MARRRHCLIRLPWGTTCHVLTRLEMTCSGIQAERDDRNWTGDAMKTDLDANYERAGYHSTQVWGQRPALLLLILPGPILNPHHHYLAARVVSRPCETLKGSWKRHVTRPFLLSSPKCGIGRVDRMVAYSFGRSPLWPALKTTIHLPICSHRWNVAMTRS